MATVLLTLTFTTVHAEGFSAPLSARPLPEALDAFAKATRYQLVYRADIAAGLSSKGADAGLTAVETLRQLLRGTGLNFTFINDRTIAIFKSPDDTRHADPPPTPPPIEPRVNKAGKLGKADEGVIHQGLLEYALATVAENEPMVVVTGTRQGGLAATQSPVPIQVLTTEELHEAAGPDLMSTLAQLVPALSMQAFGHDMAGQSLQTQLRGLSPNHVLVLIDGKRRHTTANLEVDSGSTFQGGASADLNFIPVDAIDHIEVLTQGAAAQYGTDAIAGVINIILKKNASGGSVNGTYGGYFSGGGDTSDVSANFGLQPSAAGYVNVTAEVRSHGHSNQGAVDERVINPDNLASWPGSNMASLPGYPYVNRIEGDAETHLKLVTINAGFDFGEGIRFYTLATYGDKQAASYENYRLPTKLAYADPATGLTTYPLPLGFNPQEATTERDYSVMGGLKGSLRGWNWDLSSVYGRDFLDLYTLDSANSGLYNTTGEPAPADFYDGILASTQWTTTLDLNRDFNVGHAGPLNAAFGAEYRRETYTIGAGAPDSYIDGGAQSYPGFTPTDAGTHERKNYAAYVDLAARPLEPLLLDSAGRFEHYSDFGDAIVGKLTGRWDFTPQFALRTTLSSGFRAPTLAEEYYSSTTVTPLSAFVQLPPDSTGGKLLGLSKGLQPEKSTSFSQGFVLCPIPGMSVTLDLYQIIITNRIVGSGQLIGSHDGVVISSLINSAIAANGNQLDPEVLANGQTGVNVFTNGIDTRTRGADLAFTFPMDYTFGHINYSVGATYNKTVVTHIRETPAQLGTVPLFDATALSDLTTASPKYVANLGLTWSSGNATVNLLEKIYGPASEFESDNGDNPTGNLEYFRSTIPVTPITSLDLTYRFNRQFRLTVGANNLFNRFPSKLNNTLLAHYDSFAYGDDQGVRVYPAFSPFGINGGFYYVKAAFSF